jgi:hypothetical protein
MWVMLQNVPGRQGEVRAKVVDLSETGVGIELSFWLREKELVVVNGLSGIANSNGKVRARVVSCQATSDGYRAGLAYEEGHEPKKKAVMDEALPEYYELLQISPNSDPDIIHRVFRLLAQRYHPDNTETGNDEMFRQIADAYKVLSDPEKRAAYDVNLHAYRQARWRIFDQRQSAVGKAAEKSKRQGILELLYAARRGQPTQPSMNLHELEELLGCPREHLEFSLWYLKENGMVARGDNGRYAITAKGVDMAEVRETEFVGPDKLLTAGEPVEQSR